MPKRALRESLERLHNELQSADSVDAESRALIDELIRDLHKLAAEADEAADAQEHSSLGDRLREASGRFEATHPALAEPLERVIAALANLGI